MKAFVVLGLCFCNLAGSSAWKRQSGDRLAIARTFVSADFQSLLESFQKWPRPCLGRRTDVTTDLFLVYSGDLNGDKDLLSEVEQLVELVGPVYAQCFGKVKWVSCNIPKEVDMYNKELQDKHQGWVNGPNRQFETTFRILQNMGYDKMFLMEADSIPLKTFWLDILLDEIEDKSPFMLLGSQYKGDKWDPFRDILPEALLRHINGNAVYNLKDHRLDRIVQQLEQEVRTTGNGIPYDYRIAQIVIEAKEGIVADLPSYQGFEKPDLQDVLDFLGFDDSSTADLLKPTKVIGNYADTNMIVEYFSEDDVIVHGARMFQSWKKSPFTGDITLVVSDYTGTLPYKELLKQINQIETLPFKRLLLALTYSADTFVLDEVQIDLPVDVFHREQYKDSLRDYCDVLPYLKTEWFMLTDSHARLASKMSLMVTEEEGKPLASFVNSDVAECLEDEYCLEELLLSKHFVPDNDRIFRNDDTVFSVAEMKRFCTQIDGSRPSATAYFAFLESQDAATRMYAFSDRAKRGSRLPFRSYLAPEQDKGSTTVALHRFLQTTNTTCGILITQAECEAVIGCSWNAQFQSCFVQSVIVIVVTIIQIGPVDATQPTSADITSLTSVCSAFLSRVLNTNVKCTFKTFVFNGSLGRRILQQGGTFDVSFDVTLEQTDAVTGTNVLVKVDDALTANKQDFIAEVKQMAVVDMNQGPSSSLDKVTNFADVMTSMPEPPKPQCSGPFGFIFCALAKAFGSFAGFIKWIVNILTFGKLFS